MKHNHSWRAAASSARAATRGIHCGFIGQRAVALQFRIPQQFRNSKSVSGEPPSDWQILLEEEAIPRGLGAPALSTVTLSDPTKAKRAGDWPARFGKIDVSDRSEFR